MNKLQVIFCTDGIFPNEIGGMQRHSRLLIEHLVATGEVELVVVHPHEQKLFKENPLLTEEMITPIDKNKNYLLQNYAYSKRVLSVIERYPRHIIYSQGMSVWYGIRKIRSRLIVNPHGLEPYQGLTLKERLFSTPFRMVFDHLFKNASKVVSLGGQLTGIINSRLGAERSKVVELPNAVSLPHSVAERNWNKKPLELFFIARFAHNKGIHILIEAIEQLNNEGYEEELKFNLGGKGPLFEHYSTTKKFKNLNYLGFVSDEQLEELYSSNDLFVFPTLFEGMPTVVLEAMSHGMPVVVSDVGATAELVNKENGFLIKKNNIPELKAAILRFYAFSEMERKAMSDKAYAHVKENYTWNKVADKHIQLFKDMSRLQN